MRKAIEKYILALTRTLFRKMDGKAVGYSGALSMPVFCEVNPPHIGYFNYLDKERELTLYREVGFDPLLSGPQVYRDKMAFVANTEVKLEITDNTFIIPYKTKG